MYVDLHDVVSCCVCVCGWISGGGTCILYAARRRTDHKINSAKSKNCWHIIPIWSLLLGMRLLAVARLPDNTRVQATVCAIVDESRAVVAT